MGKEAGHRAASGVRGCSPAAGEAVPAQATRAEGVGAAAAPGAERMPRPAGPARPAAGARRRTGRHRRHAPTAPAEVRAAAQAAAAPPGREEEEAHRAVRLLRRAVHDGVAPEAARAGAEAPEQGGASLRGDERAVPGMQRPPLLWAQRRAASHREAARPAAHAQRRRSLTCTVTRRWLNMLVVCSI